MATKISTSFTALSLLIGAALLAGCPSGAPSADSCAPVSMIGPTTVSYANQIVPLFMSAGCLSSACHGGTFPASGFDLRSYATSFVMGDNARRINACEISPGHPENSFLIEKLRSSDPRQGLQMPLDGELLTEAQISLIETWINEGAQDN